MNGGGWDDRWKLVPGSTPASGGQGQVRKVRSVDSDAVGALKTPHLSSLTTERRQRFARDARALADLSVPGVPQLLDDGTDGDEPYLVAEWVEGRTLQQAGRADLDEACGLVLQLFRILASCHDSGIVHRDIKPLNVLIDGDNQLWLVDFGMSWFVEPVDDLKTETQVEIGNRFLRLPEHAAGTESKDARSDLTLAVGILFFLLSGSTPRTLLSQSSHMPHEGFAWPEPITNHHRWPDIQRIFDRGLLVDIDLRFQRAQEVIDILVGSRERASPGPELHSLQDLKQLLARVEDSQATQLSVGLRAELSQYASAVVDRLNSEGLRGSAGPPSGEQTVRLTLNLRSPLPGNGRAAIGTVVAIVTKLDLVVRLEIAESDEQVLLYQGPSSDLHGIGVALANNVDVTVDLLSRRLIEILE